MELLNLLAAIVGGDQPTIYICTLILLNFVCAVMAAWRMGTFDPRQLANVFGRQILPLVVGYYVMRFALYVMGAGGPLGTGADVAALGAITTTLLASIWQHWGDMGLPFVKPVNRVMQQAATRLGFGSGNGHTGGEV